MRQRKLLECRWGAAQQASRATVLGWNRLALQAIRTVQPGPAAAARALVVLHTCMYNAWAAYDDAARQTSQGVAVRLPRAERSAASKAGAMSHAACCALSERFPSQKSLFAAHMASLGLEPEADAEPFSPAGIGRIQAAAVLRCYRGDGAWRERALPVAPDWCTLAQAISARNSHGDDEDVRLFLALATMATMAARTGRAPSEPCEESRLAASRQGGPALGKVMTPA